MPPPGVVVLGSERLLAGLVGPLLPTQPVAVAAVAQPVLQVPDRLSAVVAAQPEFSPDRLLVASKALRPT